MTDVIKQKDQIAMLEACRDFTDGKEFPGMFSYPGCGWDLVQQGLVTEDKKITTAGRALLWHLDKGEDPTNSASSIEVNFELKLNKGKSPIRYNSDNAPHKCSKCDNASFQEKLSMLVCDKCGQRYESL